MRVLDVSTGMSVGARSVSAAAADSQARVSACVQLTFVALGHVRREAAAVCNGRSRCATDTLRRCAADALGVRGTQLENLMLANTQNSEEIKLIDFGFSKIFSSDNGMFAILGSPYYVAPEVLRYDR